MIGIFAVDPGGSTGLAWGIFNPKAEIGDSLRGRLYAGSATVSGEIPNQIRAVAKRWHYFYRSCVKEHFMAPEDVWYVVENFIYDGGSYAGDSAKVSTALIWGVEGYRMGRADEWSSRRGRREIIMPQMVLQSAGDAKGFATSNRIKEWELWVKGRDHERSAWQHVAFFLKRYQIQNP